MRFTTAAEAVKLICPHSSVYIQGSTSIPEVLVRAMTDRAAELTDVTLYSGFAVGRADAPYCSPEYKDTFLVNSLFVANNIRRWLAQGYGQSTPAFLGEIPGLFRDGTLPVDVAILNLSRPNEEGYCSFGVSADLAVSAVECAKTVIAQVNTAMPFSYGDAVIHLSRVAAAVEVDDPLVMPGTTVASLALGSRRLYDYMDYRKDLVRKDVAWTNDPFRIRENPRVMAINSAVEVDLTGQVCADSVGERIISGVGGQHDFMYGGALSEGGKTFIAIPSTTPKGESKIKALLTPGAGVVTTRHMVQHVVTEYGVAHLRGRNLAERARALISVAHPSVREELEKAACERFGYSFLRIK